MKDGIGLGKIGAGSGESQRKAGTTNSRYIITHQRIAGFVVCDEQFNKIFN